MSSLAYDFMFLAVDLFAATPIVGTETPSPNPFHHEWSLLGVLIAGVGGLAAWAGWVFRAAHRDVERASLALEQSASSMFVGVVLAESKRVFSLADDHLPLALSQARNDSPQPSRFDHFCKALREIPEEQLDDRGHYADVIRESFARIIAENAERLIDAMSAKGTSSTNTVLNPTGIRFSLEADRYLRFSEISKFDSDNRRIADWFSRLWSIMGGLLVVGIIAMACSLPSVLHNANWAHTLGVRCMWITAAAVALAACSMACAFCLRHALIQRSKSYGDPSEAKRLLDQRRQANASSD